MRQPVSPPAYTPGGEAPVPRATPTGGRVLVAFLLACAVALRLGTLGGQGLFLDEAWSWAVSQLPLPDLFATSAVDRLPPLYFLLLKGALVLLPDTEAGLRLFSAACSLVASLVIAAFAARRWDFSAAAAGVLFLGLSSFDLYYAQETRMYTLLALLWLASYLLLLQGLEGRRWRLLAWGVVNVLLAWTHYYGLVVAAVHAVLALAAGASYWPRRQRPLSWFRSLGLGIAITAAGCAPAAWIAVRFASVQSGGAWVPAPGDFGALAGLVTAGVTAARGYFLDPAHLSLPALALLPSEAWLAAGLLTCGSFFAIALVAGALRPGPDRLAAFLAAGSVFGVVGLVYLTASALGLQIWALKGFLGAAYIVYLWAGRGLALTKPPGLRWLAAVAAVILALASILPYFTGWSKTDARVALTTLPAGSSRAAVLLDRAYRAPIVRYYLGPAAVILAPEPRPDGVALLVVDGAGILAGQSRPLSCADASVTAASGIVAYGPPASALQKDRAGWPGCLSGQPLWVYEGGAWNQLAP